MEAVGFAISVAGVVSILHTCLDAYQALNIALAMGDAAAGLHLRFRIEEMRLRLWGRSRGIHFDISTISGDPATTDSAVPSPSGKMSEAPAISVRENDILHIPQMRRLTLDILGSILNVLEKQGQLIEKYDALKTAISQGGPEDGAGVLTLSAGQIAAAKAVQGDQVKGISKRTHFVAKVRWAVRDKQVLTDLLDELTALNDGLQSLLPRADAASLSQSLAAEVISAEPNLQNVTSESFGSMGRKAATAIELRQENRTNMSEMVSPFSAEPLSESGPESQWLIPISCFPDFTEPRLKYQQTFQDVGGEKALEVPAVRAYYNFAPIPDGDDKSTEFIVSQPPEVVLIEWRSQRAESKDSRISAEALARRRGHLVSLLHRTASADNDYRVLNCLGFCLALGRLPEGATHPVVGFVYRLPDSAASHATPVSLRAILGDTFASEKPHIPNLEERYLLAQSLAASLYQLQCAGWIHRKISSHNILFFEDKTTGQINLDQPYLCGWQYARPDTRIAGHKPGFRDTESSRIGGVGDLDMYVHPDRLDRVKGLPRFRKSFDIYSLGIVLMEIAFWEPILAFTSVEQRRKIESFERPMEQSTAWSSNIREAAEKELGPEMGSAYRNAVLTCLAGLKTANRENRSVEADDMKDMETGIEGEFFWKVVDVLNHL